MSDIFLSYSREDLATARRFADGFEREGFSVWWDQSLDAGEAFDHATEKALEEARIVVVLWSKHSVESRWVRAEANQADRLKKLVPVEIEPCKRPIMFDLTQTAELSQWKGDPSDKGWQALVTGLRRQLGKAASSVGTAAAAASSSPASSRKTLGVAIGVIALLIAVVVALALYKGRGKPTTQTATEASVAVLPFRDMSPGQDQEYFADGITEEILNSLAALQDLKVTGRTSSFAFKGKDVDLRTIGDTLGVRHLLEGSVRKAGNQLKITAQLNDAATGFHVWSRTYERPMDEVFKVQEDIARSVAQALEVSLGVGELGNRPGMTRNIDAYDAFLASQPYNEPTPDSLRAAIDLLERATALDPTFVRAWSSLANQYAFANSISLAGDTPEAWAGKVDAAMERIRSISPFGQAVYEVMTGDRSQNMWAMVDAEKHFRQSRALAKELGHEAYFTDNDAVFVLVTGRFTEEIAIMERAKTRDPLNAFISFLKSRALAAKGDLTAAIAEEDRGMKMVGFQIPLRTSAVVTALATRDRKQIEQRIALVIDAENDPHGPNTVFSSAMKDRLNNPSGAPAELRRLAKTTTDNVELSAIAVWMAYFGDPAGALDVYRNHADLFRSVRRSALPFDIWSPVMRDMRKLPGFKDLVREMGLVDYWRTYGWGDLCKPVGTEDFACT